MRVRIKVCGITRPEDAQRAVDLGADALGFNFVPGSPRGIAPQDAERIIRGLPPFVVAVGVVADMPGEAVVRLARDTGVAVMQLHGEETPEACAALPIAWYKAHRVDSRFRLEDLARYPRPRDGRTLFLLDGSAPGKQGGTGRTFDWRVARRAADHGRVILAGGLTPENVVEAIRIAGPFMVDVNSGVESSPGIKDPVRMALFVRRASEAALPRHGGTIAGEPA